MSKLWILCLLMVVLCVAAAERTESGEGMAQSAGNALRRSVTRNPCPMGGHVQNERFCVIKV